MTTGIIEFFAMNDFASTITCAGIGFVIAAIAKIASMIKGGKING